MNVLKQLYLASDYHDKSGMIFNADCMEIMSSIKQEGVFDVTLTDIPYDMVNRADNGLRNLDKSHADILTFNLEGSYGYRDGLLEVSGDIVEVDDAVEGYLTAQDIIERIEKHQYSMDSISAWLLSKM